MSPISIIKCFHMLLRLIVPIVPWRYHGAPLSWSSLSQVHTTDATWLACEGEAWGVYCESTKSDLCHATVVLHWDAVFWHLSPVLESDRTSCRGISRGLEALRFEFIIDWSLWDLTGILAALFSMCLTNLGTMCAFWQLISRLRTFAGSCGVASCWTLRRGPVCC